MLLLPEKTTKYPKWLLILFAISSTSWFVAFLGIMIELIIALSIWQLPDITNWINLWFALSTLGIVFCVWYASKYGR